MTNEMEKRAREREEKFGILWRTVDVLKFAAAEVELATKEHQQHLLNLYVIGAGVPCPHPPAALGLVTSLVDRMQARIGELERLLEEKK